MRDKNYLHRFLKINGVSPDSPDEAICDMLKNAGWTEEETKVALEVIRSTDTETVPATRPDNLSHQSSPELSSLLGVTVVVDPRGFVEREELSPRKRLLKRIFEGITIFVFAAGVVALGWGIFTAFQDELLRLYAG